jgi:trans-aconitate 2-methyltransferase
MWDADQYLRFAGERGRPFFDLLAQVPPGDYRRILDLGCGPGHLTGVLAERWPNATVLGVDSSPAMLAGAAAVAVPGRLSFVPGDIATWRPDGPVDLIVSNAALQWVPGHDRLLPTLAGLLNPGGTLAVQVPSYFQTPAHHLIDEVSRSDPWRPTLAGVGLQPGAVQPVDWYAERLLELGLTVNAWDTTYLHVLTGPDPVLEWLKGSALRPLLEKLAPADQADFLRQLGVRFRAAYPPRAGRTLFPFPRTFVVATRRE